MESWAYLVILIYSNDVINFIRVPIGSLIFSHGIGNIFLVCSHGVACSVPLLLPPPAMPVTTVNNI